MFYCQHCLAVFGVNEKLQINFWKFQSWCVVRLECVHLTTTVIVAKSVSGACSSAVHARSALSLCSARQLGCDLVPAGANLGFSSSLTSFPLATFRPCKVVSRYYRHQLSSLTPFQHELHDWTLHMLKIKTFNFVYG